MVVNVKDYGAVGNGLNDDTAAIQAAIATGEAVFIPKGLYRITAPLTLSTFGQRLMGENGTGSYLITDMNSTHDMVRIASTHVEVEHIFFRPSSVHNICIRTYTGLSHIHHNRFLSAEPGEGTAILLTDRNPMTNTNVVGAYIHTISNNWIGTGLYEWEYGIRSDSPVMGQQANKILYNQIMANTGIYIDRGGGNFYSGNLIQPMSPLGVAGIDFGPNVTGETLTGNYIELFNYGIQTRRIANDYLVFNAIGNHFDNCTQDYRSVGTNLFSIDNNNFSIESRIRADQRMTTLAYTANGQVLTPDSTFSQITGAGGYRTNCGLGNGQVNGQHLYLRGFTWPVTVLKGTNLQLAGNAASVTFGNSAGMVSMMHLIWDAGYAGGRWFEVSRTTV